MGRLVAQRLRAWPHDAESHLLAALLAEERGDLTGAVARYRRAVVTVANGRCYVPGWQAYRALLERTDFPPDAARLGAGEVEACEQVFRRIGPATPAPPTSRSSRGRLRRRG
jgi:hypothetical protein